MMASHIAGRARVRKLGASSGRQHLIDDGFQCRARVVPMWVVQQRSNWRGSLARAQSGSSSKVWAWTTATRSAIGPFTSARGSICPSNRPWST
jgi:hypothetical protein